MTRLTIVMVATLVFASCQNSASPTSPTVSSPSTASTPGPPLVIEGGYTLTFTTDESCVVLPREVRSRTYVATVTQAGRFNFVAQLSGASFYPFYDAFTVHREIGNVARFYFHSVFAPSRWLDQTAIFERLPTGGAVSIRGAADVSYDGSRPSSSVPFAGVFAYCASPQDADDLYPPDCARQPVACESSTHTLAVARR